MLGPSRGARILIVDDEPAITLALSKRLRREGYECITAGSAGEALKRLAAFHPHLVVSDVRMPGISGLELLKDVKEIDPRTRVILITAYSDIDFVIEALRHDADDYLLKPFNLKEFTASVRRALEREARSHTALGKTQPGIVALARAIEGRDRYAAGHIERVAMSARTTGARLGLDDTALRDLWLAALLHDVGKLSVPETTLNKVGPLAEEEMAILRGYPVEGARIVAGVLELDAARTGILHHRERWDGTGYPEGLASENISLAGRIIGVAEDYDAMCHDRAYRKALDGAELANELEAGRSSRYGPDVMDAFLATRTAAGVDLP